MKEKEAKETISKWVKDWQEKNNKKIYLDKEDWLLSLGGLMYDGDTLEVCKDVILKLDKKATKM